MQTDAYSELSVGHHPSDPDAQQTLTDFLDYTEFFPSDLIRSLSLIGQLDEAYQDDAQRVHQLTKSYGALPALAAEERPNPRQLRKNISASLDHAVRAREASLAEASRLCNVAESLYGKLVGIRSKLAAMPKPPSREPTPAPQPKSPVQARMRKRENERAANGKAAATKDASATIVLPKPQKNRQRRIIVPGEPLPPFDPASPGADISSESESDRASPMDTIRVEPFGLTPRVDRPPKKLKDPSRDGKLLKPYSTAGPLPKVRPRGVFGTNVHSQVAGISVSNAMASLTPPPENPLPGSEWSPWLELTDWELNILRRRMKKNANWIPSDTMKKRTLAEKGRGQAAYLKAKEEAEKNGTEFLNEKPHRAGRRAEAAPPSDPAAAGGESAELVNRGMKLNEQKKLKQVREYIASTDQGMQLDSTELEKIIADAGKNVEELFKANSANQPPPPFLNLPGQGEASKPGRKRKPDSSGAPGTSSIALNIDPALEDVAVAGMSGESATAALDDQSVNAEDQSSEALVGSSSEPAAKKQRIKIRTSGDDAAVDAQSATKAGQQIPLAPEGAPPSPRRGRPGNPNSRSKASTPGLADGFRSRTQSPRSTAAMPPPTRDPSAKRPSSSRGPSVTLTMNTKAASAEPPNRKLAPRRSSNVSLPTQRESTPKAAPTAATSERRARKPAPGFTKSAADDANTVSSTKRKVKPGKPVEKMIAFDEVDPDEPTYCMCGGVSWGDMVACENENCEGGEWFHFECVGLTEHPPRRQKWYCPVCRERLGVDVTGSKAAEANAAKGRVK